MNFSEAKILVVPGYMVDIPGSDFPAQLMILFLSTVRRRVHGERGAWKERTRDTICGHSGIIKTNSTGTHGIKPKGKFSPSPAGTSKHDFIIRRGFESIEFWSGI